MAANGSRRQNCIRRLQIGDRTFSDQSEVGQAAANHFREFYRRGSPNQWRWRATGASILTNEQNQDLIAPFSKEELRSAIRGLNSEGALGRDDIPVFFYLECWDVVGAEVMSTIEEFKSG